MLGESTQLLRRLVAGDGEAEPRLIQLVYGELHRLAGRMLAENPRATIQATELIHEAWLRIADAEADPERFDGQRHFRRVAARAMRFVIVDRARARMTTKRGGARVAVTLDDQLIDSRSQGAETAVAVHDGLERLATVDPDLAQLVELRFFGGLTMAEIAENLGVSERSAHRMWRLARAWWLDQYGDQRDDDSRAS